MIKHAALPFSLLLLTAALTLAGCDSGDNTSTEAAPPDSEVPSDTDTQVPPETEPSPPYPLQTDKLNVVAAYPNTNESRIALVATISITFDANLIAGLNTSELITLSLNGSPVAGTVEQTAADTLEFQPAEILKPSTTYTIALDDTLMSESGLNIGSDGWDFTTVADVYLTPQDVIDHCMSDLDIEMLAAVNAARIQHRACGEDDAPAVGKLAWNCLLQEAAISHSEDMATNDFFSHTGSDGSTVADRITRTGYRWSYAGENLAAGQRNVAETVADLLDSPGHCLNIMSPHFTEFGFGYRVNNDAYYKRYWTQNFALPR